jgi:hypothetical protein
MQRRFDRANASPSTPSPTTPGLEQLAQLRDRPCRAVHPFRLYLLERELTLDQAATLLGCSRRTVAAIVNEWRVPQQAQFWALALGRGPSDLFPAQPRRA